MGGSARGPKQKGAQQRGRRSVGGALHGASAGGVIIPNNLCGELRDCGGENVDSFAGVLLLLCKNALLPTPHVHLLLELRNLNSQGLNLSVHLVPQGGQGGLEGGLHCLERVVSNGLLRAAIVQAAVLSVARKGGRQSRKTKQK